MNEIQNMQFNAGLNPVSLCAVFSIQNVMKLSSLSGSFVYIHTSNKFSKNKL